MKKITIASLALAATAIVHQPATAQIGGRLRGAVARISGPMLDDAHQKRTAELVRLTGSWDSPLGRIEIRAGGSSADTVLGKLEYEAGRWTDFNVTSRWGGLAGYGLMANGVENVSFAIRFVDDNTIEFRVPTAGEAVKGRNLWSAVRADTAQPASPFAGAWETNLGPVTLVPEGRHLLGRLVPVDGGSAGRMTVALHHLEDDGRPADRASGAWAPSVAGVSGSGAVRWELSADKQSFFGTYTRQVNGKAVEETWTGRRAAAAPAPQPTPGAPPVVDAPPAPPPVVTPPPPAPGPVVAGAFKPLRRFDVRLDRLWEARGYPTRQVHAFVTIRNASPTPQYITSGFLKALLTDADGVAQERGQVYRAAAEPAALFNSTPVVQPGAELKIRYVFIPDEGSAPATFTLSEGDKRAEFPASL